MKKSGAPIKIIQGRVEALRMRPQDSLENERIAAFYQSYLKAYQIFIRDGVKWFAGDLDGYQPPLRAERAWLDEKALSSQVN